MCHTDDDDVTSQSAGLHLLRDIFRLESDLLKNCCMHKVYSTDLSPLTCDLTPPPGVRGHRLTSLGMFLGKKK